MPELATSPRTEATAPKRTNQVRALQACYMCKIKKAKCDEGQPCKSCEVHNWQCIYKPNIRNATQTSNQSSVESSLKPSHGAALNPTTTSRPDMWPGQMTRSDENSSLRNNNDEPDENDMARRKRLKGDNHVVPYFVSGTEQDVEPLGDINEHTNGTEYYGRSSNLAMLGQLFAHARSDLLSGKSDRYPPPDTEEIRTPKQLSLGSEDGSTSKRPHLSNNRISIVNLLYDIDQSPETSSSLKTQDNTPRSSGAEATPQSAAAVSQESPDIIQATTKVNGLIKARGSEVTTNLNETRRSVDFQAYEAISSPKVMSTDAFGRGRTELLMEQEYIRIFFSNLHYIHPFLSWGSFIQKCEREIWSIWPLERLPRSEMHFMALYNIIIAVGALTSSPEVLSNFRKQLDHQNEDSYSDALQATSSIHVSKIFFQRSKKFLGDCFESSSLESAQTLILISLYCQNALKPHACYMYSGMAVRTALAIGLTEESMPRSLEKLNSARKTWWAIYSQEVDMCCSSGRISGLMSPENYNVSLPEIQVNDTSDSNSDTAYMSIIPEMVHFAALLLRASKEIYFDAKHLPIIEKSKKAFNIDQCFTDWRQNLPSWLHMEANPLKEAEWMGKQKIVLELRYQNAKILLHRPFVAASNLHKSSDLSRNVEACLSAARSTIHLLYDTYLHRHYFRTWRYNCTYTVYAATIVLYVILLDYAAVPATELLSDVKKSIDVLLSMEEAPVVKRCADLVQELFSVAQEHVKRRQATAEGMQEHHQNTQNPQEQHEFPGALPHHSNPSLGHSEQENSHIQSALDILQPSFGFNYSGGNGTSMNEMWASMMDPVTLESFAIRREGGDNFAFESPWTSDEINGMPSSGDMAWTSFG